MSEMTQETGSQTVESQEIERDADTEALFDSFDLAPKQTERKDIEFPKMDEPNDLAMDHEEESRTETEEQSTAETKKYKVKYNKEEVEVDESQVPDLIEKGLNLDKVRGQKTEYEKALDRAAKLQGFKDHAELIANLDRLEQQQQQKEREAHDNLRAELRQQAEDAGLDPDQVQSYLDNHPLVKQAEKALQERDEVIAERQKESAQAEVRRKWGELYDKYPHLVEESQAFERGEDPVFYNADMKRRVQAGYDPLDAFELAHRETLTAQSKKSAEQKLIKQQQLGLRGHVNEQTATPPDEASLLPAQIALAEEFGVSVKGVQRQNQILKSRR